jgi:hypothetical protein
MVVATWVAAAVLVGTTLAFLTLTTVPSEKLYDSIVDGGQLGDAAIVFVLWSLLTFACGAPLTWAVVVLRTRVIARRQRRDPSEEQA